MTMPAALDPPRHATRLYPKNAESATNLSTIDPIKFQCR
jgi:hypothetical protein